MPPTSDLQPLTDQVNATVGVEQSAIACINGLADKLTASKNDPAAIQALADQMKASAAALADAVAANPV